MKWNKKIIERINWKMIDGSLKTFGHRSSGSHSRIKFDSFTFMMCEINTSKYS
jgi:hypothetical protein